MKVVLAAGGTAGHLFPALQVGMELKRLGHEVVLMGSFSVASKEIAAAGLESIELNARGLQRDGFWKDCRAACSLVVAIIVSLRRLKNIAPQCVAGFGGYGAFPVVYAASLLRLPTLIHEQNVVPGRANRMLKNRVSKIALSFKPSEKHFIGKPTVVTGCPIATLPSVRPKGQILESLGLVPDKTTILVFGGSQGSQIINETFSEACEIIKGRIDYQVIHLTGRGKSHGIAERYQQADVRAVVHEFYRPLQELMSASDLVVCRAGASTILELVHFRCPSILIPYPYAGGHQRENARVVADASLGCLIDQSELTPQRLADTVCERINGRPKSDDFARVEAELYIQTSTQRLTQELLQLHHES